MCKFKFWQLPAQKKSRSVRGFLIQFDAEQNCLALSIRWLFCVCSVILFASHPEKLAISIRAPFLERSVFYLRAFLCTQHLLFASRSEKLAISIRAPF